MEKIIVCRYLPGFIFGEIKLAITVHFNFVAVETADQAEQYVRKEAENMLTEPFLFCPGRGEALLFGL